MNFLQIGNQVINVTLVTDINHATIERNGIPHLEVTISFSADNYISLVGDHARVVWEFFSAAAFGLPVAPIVQVAP